MKREDFVINNLTQINVRVAIIVNFLVHVNNMLLSLNNLKAQ